MLQLSSSATTPNNPASQTQAKAILAESKKTKALPVSVADQVGKNFANAAPGDPGAWDVALDFLAYRSLLNEDAYQPQTNILRSQQIATEFHIITPFGKQDPRVRQVKPWVPIEDAAELDDLNRPLVQIPNSVLQRWLSKVALLCWTE